MKLHRNYEIFMDSEPKDNLGIPVIVLGISFAVIVLCMLIKFL